ncbi:hypothetical protein D3C71_1889640 [compost metagenome]
MKAWSLSNACKASSGASVDFRYSADSRTSVRTSGLSAFQPPRWFQPVLAMPCSVRPWRATAWVAQACMRMSSVVCTTRPSVWML